MSEDKIRSKRLWNSNVRDWRTCLRMSNSRTETWWNLTMKQRVVRTIMTLKSKKSKEVVVYLSTLFSNRINKMLLLLRRRRKSGLMTMLKSSRRRKVKSRCLESVSARTILTTLRTSFRMRNFKKYKLTIQIPREKSLDMTRTIQISLLRHEL